MKNIAQDFPILKKYNRGKPLIYLDSAASTQKPLPVIHAIQDFYLNDYANIHRGIYELSEKATQLFESARQTVKDFIHAPSKDNIIFVSGTTAGINLIAHSYGQTFTANDEIILSEMEHHSNIVPWHLLAEKLGLTLKIIPVTNEGALDLAAYQALFSAHTKLVAITHVSNVLGTINPIREMADIAHAHQVPLLVDGAQAVAHLPVEVTALDCDFYVFSAHKLYGPTGMGVVYGKSALLDRMPPYQGGGDMIETVAFDNITYAKAPYKFEAGTPNITGAIGLQAAIRYVNDIGIEVIYQHEQALLKYAEAQLANFKNVKRIGTVQPKVGVISFIMENIHAHDIGTFLDQAGIAVRAGHHCAMPLMERFKVPATVRASLGLYNTESDIDALINTLHEAERFFG